MNSELLRSIREQASAIAAEVVAIRRHLHAHPELSFEEKATAAFVGACLHRWGIAYQAHVGGHGITGVLKSGDHQWPCVALRAELDALPIEEQNDVPYKSKHPGIMHACGHDVHTAALLGALYILNRLCDQWQGAIRFLFQPGEERLPGGATLMIREGVLAHPVPQAIIAQHVYVPLRAGQAGFCSGRYMASSDEWYITVKGKGGHAADPQTTQNPIYAAATLLCRLDELRQQLHKTEAPVIFSVGTVQGGTATNIVPDQVTVSGTLRTLDEGWRQQVQQQLVEVVQETEQQKHIEISCNIKTGYPVLFNDPVVTGLCRTAAELYLGSSCVVDLPVRMASEDFAFYTQLVPGCFYRLGTGNPERGITSGVHTATFDVDESALETGSGLMAWMACFLLNHFRTSAV
ncbi:MAG: M20 family metallopeptidase [Chitinophagales bacterium]|nr:M20 family metallopeptidase [Chitinophagales bacterium]MDW8394549.1 M20 family metallopeptidase [Chitinophagales bacterium]